MSVHSAVSASFEEYLNAEARRIDRALDGVLPKSDESAKRGLNISVLHEAMRYAALNGGKRIRPMLTLAVCDMLGGNADEALPAACAIELIHSYSLIHDDLPCLDNDAFRRGQPTCHKKYGEAIALLAGDGLQTLAFQLISKIKDREKSTRILEELSLAAGSSGMVGGQVMELVADDSEIDLTALDAIHIHKTGQMIKVSALCGAIMAGADHGTEVRIVRLGEYLGFAFQIVDDILDGDGYLRFMSAHEAQEKASEVIEKAKAEINRFSRNERVLKLTDLIIHRTK